MKDYLIEKLTNIDHSDILKKKKDEQLKQIYNKLSIEKVEEYNNLIYKDISPENIIPNYNLLKRQKKKSCLIIIETLHLVYIRVIYRVESYKY